MKKIFTAAGLCCCLTMFGLTTKAQYVLKQANEQYNLYNYAKAVELYLKAYEKDQTLYIAEHIASCYLLNRDFKNAEKWYATVVSMPESKTENIFTYAEVLKNNSKYLEAKQQYIQFYAMSIAVDSLKLKYWTSSCDSAIKWINEPAPVDVRNETFLNSPKSDWGAITFKNAVVFTSDRFNSNRDDEKRGITVRKGSIDENVYGWTGNDYLSLYQSISNAATVNGMVSLFPLEAGTDFHVGAASFNANGTEMYFTLTRIPKNLRKQQGSIKTINLEIYSARKDASGKWSKPIPFRYNNVQKWSVGDPYVTPDGQTLYFVSNMPGGLGGTDIYYCTRNIDGIWSDLTNAKLINTTGNERTPYLYDKNTLYFSSDAGVGMGGLDIYRAKLGANGFASPVNLQYPVNSPQDDFSYNKNSATTGYFSSNRISGAGSDDIYSYKEKPVAKLRLEGIVYNKSTMAPIQNSTVVLSKINGNVASVETDALGRYAYTLSERSDYALKGVKSGYLSDNQTLSTVGVTPPRTLKKDLYLTPIELNKAIKIDNIYYDLDKSYIRPDAARELDKLITVMKDNPTIEIEIGSHTDSRADDDYNMALSRRRSNAVVEYMINVGGIDESRIIARGYGETRLLNRCENGVQCSEAQHQLNRRTEFTILRY